MRFSGTHTLGAPISAIWRALHQPDILEVIIPDCRRIERQPGYRPESAGDYALSFEIGAPNTVTGAEPIIGWLEVDRQRPPHHLTMNLTLNDTMYFMRIQGTIDLVAQAGETQVRYSVDAELPNLRGVGWSASAHAESEQIIADIFTRLAQVTEQQSTSADSTPASSPPLATRPQVLLTTPRGNVMLLPATEVHAPTQSMLRRLLSVEQRRTARQQRIIALAALGTLTVLASGIVFWLRRVASPLTPLH